MVDRSILEGRVDVNISANSGTITAPAGGRNFILNATPADIANYARQGSDLVIEFANGQTVTIENFFAGAGHNLALSNGDLLQLVDFSNAITAGGDGIVEASIGYDAVTEAATAAAGGGSTGMLLGVLGGLAAIGGLAAAAGGGSSSDDKDNANSAPPPPPDPIFVKAQPVLSGDGRTAGEIIKIYSADGATFYGETTVDASGKWQITITQSLGNNGDKVKVQFTAGGTLGDDNSVGTAFETVELTIDTIAPAAEATIDGLTAATDSGAPGDYITNKKKPVIEGKLNETLGTGEKLQISVEKDGDPVVWQDVTVSGTNWNYAVTSDLEDGKYNIKTQVIDAAGNVKAGDSQELTIDATDPTAPVITEAAKADGATVLYGDEVSTDKLTLKGTAEPNSTVEISYDSSQVSVVADATGAWTTTIEVPLQQEYTFAITATDKAGNTSPATDFVIAIDTTPPTAGATIDGLTAATDSGAPGDYITNKKKPEIEGKLSEELGTGEKLQISVEKDGVDAVWQDVTVAGTNWSYAVASDLEDGKYNIKTQVIDAAGNVKDGASQELTIDTNAPTAEATIDGLTAATDSGAPGDYLTNAKKPVIEGKLNETLGTGEKLQISVEKDGVDAVWQDVTVTGTNWSYAVTSDLEDGKYNIKTQVIDAAGNVKTGDSQELTIDTIAPTAAATIDGLTAATDSGAPGDYITNEKKPVIEGKLSEELGTGEKLQISVEKDGDPVVWKDVTVTGTNWNYAVTSDLEDGKYNIKTQVIDAAGNVKDGASQELTIDAADPTAKANLQSISKDSGIDAFASDLITIFNEDQTFTFKSVADYSADETLQIKVGSADWQAATYDSANDVWHYTSPNNLATGDNIIQSRFIDVAGNFGEVVLGTVKVLEYNTHSGETQAQALTFDANKTDLLTFSVLEADGNTAGNGMVTITGIDFGHNWGHPDGSDRIDISSLLIGYDEAHRADFVKVTDTTAGGDITISIDRDGSGTDFTGMTDLITLTGVGTGNASLDDLVYNGWLYLG